MLNLISTLLSTLVQYIMLFVLFLNSPLGFLVLIPLDYFFKLDLFFEREVTVEELQQLLNDYVARNRA